jgi:predicted Zn-dependent peptidase
MAELLLAPNTRGGLLLPQYVDSEKEKLLDLIRSRVNNKRAYAVQRCLEEMCCCEDYAVSRYGDEASCEAIYYKKLTRYYRELLRTSPIEIFYCGQASVRAVNEALRDALSGLPRGEIDWDIGTDLRMNAMEDEPRFVEECMDVSQGNLVFGFRLGECMEDPDIPALYVFNAVFGGGPTSKLFMNVREKLSLCYYASSALVLRKGLLLASSGVAFENFEKARDEILAQLEAVKNGEISDEELEWARRGVASDLRAMLDSPGELEGFWLAQALDGLDYGPAELAGLVEEVTKEQITACAKSVVCDMIYFLRGTDKAAAADGERDTDDEN